MTDIYGHRWTAAHGESPDAGSGETWSKGLAGLTGADLARGLEACITRADAWPPALPEFRALCLGIPSVDDVRADMARTSERRQPFTLLVCRIMDAAKRGPWERRHADAREADRWLREAYADAREAVMRGEPLPEPAPEIEHKPAAPKPADPAVAAAALDDIRRMLGVA